MKADMEAMKGQMTMVMEQIMSMIKMMKDLCEDFKIQHHDSTPYRPKMNGAVEGSNKNIKKIIQKITVANKDWHEMLSFVLHDYRTFVHTSTGATLVTFVHTKSCPSI